jgi:hypothetical protein
MRFVPGKCVKLQERKPNIAQVNRITIPPNTAHDLPTPASTIAFDTQQELLWVGNEYVSVFKLV